MKKLFSILMMMAIIMTFSIPSFAATPVDTTTPDEIGISLEGADETPGGIQPRANYVILNDTLDEGGNRWDQPNGYNAYRVWIENDGNETLYVTISYGQYEHEYTVSANGTKSFTVNNAHDVRHYIDYTTKSGALSEL